MRRLSFVRYHCSGNQIGPPPIAHEQAPGRAADQRAIVRDEGLNHTDFVAGGAGRLITALAGKFQAIAGDHPLQRRARRSGSERRLVPGASYRSGPRAYRRAGRW